MENNENLLIKAFVLKCTAHVKYEYYLKKAKDEGFLEVGQQFSRLAQNELHHAFAFLRALGFDESTEINLTDAIEGERGDIESLRKIANGLNNFEIITDVIEVDNDHLKIAEQLLTDMKSENAYKLKKCPLCGRIDKSGRVGECLACGRKN